MRTVTSWSFRRPLQRRYRTGFAPVSLFSPVFKPGHFSTDGHAVKHGVYQRTGMVNTDLGAGGQGEYVGWGILTGKHEGEERQEGRQGNFGQDSCGGQ